MCIFLLCYLNKLQNARYNGKDIYCNSLIYGGFRLCQVNEQTVIKKLLL